MAAQPLPNPLPLLLALGDSMADGAKNHGLAIGIKQNDEAAIRGDLDPCRAAFLAYNQSKEDSVLLHGALHAADGAAGIFLKATRAILAQTLGQTWNSAWAPTGFPNLSTAVPDNQNDRFTLCNSLASYFTANPDMEVNTTKIVVTAAQATLVYNALKTARDNARDGDTDVGNKKMTCDQAEASLRLRMRGLINELGQLLNDDDPLWKAFGLALPGAAVTPDVPAGLVVKAVSPGSVLASWPPAARADHYRTWQQIAGVHTVFLPMGSPSDCQYAYNNLPSGQTVNLYVTAVNNAGESAPSNTVTMVVP